jgi:hypothetical protein
LCLEHQQEADHHSDGQEHRRVQALDQEYPVKLTFHPFLCFEHQQEADHHSDGQEHRGVQALDQEYPVNVQFRLLLSFEVQPSDIRSCVGKEIRSSIIDDDANARETLSRRRWHHAGYWHINRRHIKILTFRRVEEYWDGVKKIQSSCPAASFCVVKNNRRHQDWPRDGNPVIDHRSSMRMQTSESLTERRFPDAAGMTRYIRRGHPVRPIKQQVRRPRGLTQAIGKAGQSEK